MSGKRQYWSKMNHDEARHAIELMNDAEAGRWLRGWLAGAGGNEASEEVLQSKPLEWRGGFSAGKSSHEDAKEYSQKQADRVSKRYTKVTTVESGSFPADENATADLPNRTNNNTTNNEQRETTKARRAAFDPSTFDALLPEDFSRLPAFVSMWHAWVSERKERKSPMTERAARMHIEKLVGFGAASIGIEAMRQAIEKRWTALYLPKDQPAGFTPAQPPRPAVERVLTYEEEQMRLPMSQRWKT